MTDHHIETREGYVKDRTTLFGFWMYLMTDLVLFASLFAVFTVFQAEGATFWAERLSVDAPYVLIETIVLLLSSATCGLALLGARTGKRWLVLLPLLITIVLGVGFLSMELTEFGRLIAEGKGWQASAFMSSYMTLVGTHGLHIFIGLIWAATLFIAILWRGFTQATMRKLLLWSMFWHFLDLVWIFIFTVVYIYAIV